MSRNVEATQEGKLLYHMQKRSRRATKSQPDKIALNISRGEPETINNGYLSFMPQLIWLISECNYKKDFPGCRVNTLVMNKKEIKQS
ncbi:hypothetical protein O9992_15060 [Vibrio lentus]|nr:hypothetical protein [Vibrio lentus]